MFHRVTTALLAVAVITGRVRAQDPTPGADLPTDGAAPIHMPSQRFMAIPTIRSAPATGVGAGVGLVALFPSDSGIAPSTIGVGGVYTTTNSWAYGIGARANLAHDDWRNLAGAAVYRLRYDFWGVGTESGDAGHSVRVNQRGDAEVAEATFLSLPHFYAGPRYRRAHFTVDPDQVDGNSDVRALISQDHRYLTSALGGALSYDTRDHVNGTTSGTWVQGNVMFADARRLGGLETFNGYQLTGNQYIPLSLRSVLAVRATLCDATIGAPVWELCLFGLDPDLRGYTAGRYRDHSLAAAQAEYRFPIWRRFGGVAFAGAGEVAPQFDHFALNDVLASGGVGLRYLVLPLARLNAGVDVGFGKNGAAGYLRLGEAF